MKIGTHVGVGILITIGYRTTLAYLHVRMRSGIFTSGQRKIHLYTCTVQLQCNLPPTYRFMHLCHVGDIAVHNSSELSTFRESKMAAKMATKNYKNMLY